MDLTRMKTVVKSKFTIAALITLVSLVLVLLFCDIKYEISDDFVVDAVLSGAYTGEYNPHMLFSNVILGNLLVFFYSHTSQISWYFVNLILLGFFSMLTVNYICLKKNSTLVGVMLAVLATVFFTNDLFILPSFTKTAAAVIAAGGLLLIESLWTDSEKKSSVGSTLSIVIAFVLMLSGSLLRFSCVYLVAPFVAIMFLLKMIEHRKEKGFVKSSFTKLGYCILLLLGLFIFESIGNYINNQSPEYREYFQYSAKRSTITDTATFGWENYEEDFKALGLDSLDYVMLKTWSFADGDNFPVSRLDEIGKIFSSVLFNSTSPKERIVQEFSNSEVYKIPVFATSLILLLVMIEIDRKSVGKIMLCIIAQIIMFGVFFYIGRIPYRIIYGLCFSLLVTILSCVSVRDITDKFFRIGLILLTAVLIGYHLPVYVKDEAYKTLSYDDYIIYADSIFTQSGKYVGSKYRFVITGADPYKNIIAHMENDAEQYYVCDFFTTIQNLYYFYNPWDRLPLNYWNQNYSYLGGCTMGHPDNQECWENNGINGSNPYLSIINDNIYVVDNYFIQQKLTYLREHYYPGANVELVDEIDGFKIWRFYIE